MTLQAWGSTSGSNTRLGLGSLKFFDTQPTGRGGGTPVMTRIPQSEVSAAKAVGERTVAAEVRAQTTLSPTIVKRGGVVAAVVAALTPTNRTEPFTYQFAPDLRARQAIGETHVGFEKKVGGEWHPLNVTARMGRNGMEVDLHALRAEYGKPLPAGMTETRNEGRPIPAAARDLDTDHDGKLQCREIGRWEPDAGYSGYSANARAYQDHISGHPGEHFVVNDPVRPSGKVSFDACHDMSIGAHLGEAKADHNGVLQASWGDLAREGIKHQGLAQQSIANRLAVSNSVSIQTHADMITINNIYIQASIHTPVIHDPNLP